MSLERRSRTSPPRLLRMLVLLNTVGAAGCGVDGQTPSCGQYPPPYDVQSEQGRALAWEALASASGPPYYCTTLPAGFIPGSGGAAGAPSEGGTGGGTQQTAGGAGGDSEMTGAGGAAE